MKNVVLIALIFGLIFSSTGCGVEPEIPVMASDLIVPTLSPNPTPTQTPEPVEIVEPTPEPSPTFDTMGGVYAQTETVDYDTDSKTPAWWSYKNQNLSVEIKHVVDTGRTLSYYVADIHFRGENPIFNKLGNGEDTFFKNGDKMSPRKQPLSSLYKIARHNNAVFAVNTDFLLAQQRLKGIQIRNGVVFNDASKNTDSLALMPDGDFRVIPKGSGIKASELLAEGITDVYSFSAPALMIDDGQLVDKTVNTNRDIHIVPNPRMGIGIYEKGHILIIAVEGMDKKVSRGLKIKAFAELFAEYNVKTAYNFDGGASVSMVFMGVNLNKRKPQARSMSYYNRMVSDGMLIGRSELVRDFVMSYNDPFPVARFDQATELGFWYTKLKVYEPPNYPR